MTALDEHHARLNRPPMFELIDDHEDDAADAARWPVPFAEYDLDRDALWFEFDVIELP